MAHFYYQPIYSVYVWSTSEPPAGFEIIYHIHVQVKLTKLLQRHYYSGGMSYKWLLFLFGSIIICMFCPSATDSVSNMYRMSINCYTNGVNSLACWYTVNNRDICIHTRQNKLDSSIKQMLCFPIMNCYLCLAKKAYQYTCFLPPPSICNVCVSMYIFCVLFSSCQRALACPIIFVCA